MQELIEKLQTLHESDRATGELIALRERAVPALKGFLLGGRPSTVFQPRVNAVRALAQIGVANQAVNQDVKRILIVYLRSARKLDDAAIAMGEEAVRNTAAEELANWNDESVASLMMELLREHPLAGACRAAGRLQLTSAIPFLTAALSDDVVRPPAIEALKAMLPEATPLLIHTVLAGCGPYRGEVEPAQRRCARAAAEVLSEAVLTVEGSSALAPALGCRDPEIAVGVATALLKNGVGDRKGVAEELLQLLSVSPWFVRDQIRALVEECGPEALLPVEHQIRVRSATDDVLPMLLALRQRIGEQAG